MTTYLLSIALLDIALNVLAVAWFVRRYCLLGFEKFGYPDLAVA